MAYYQALVHGSNFILNFDGDENKAGGFYTTRIVKAANHDEAELKIIEIIKTDQNLHNVSVKHRSTTPKLYVEELAIISWFQYIRSKPGSGYTFYIGES
ncbi:hypothetical protein DZA50_04870 [Kangiella sp. HD9-110m-PIT-SAG07]|nr:hypothetical protein DZA50_04870 [Kangiella sp. HD9-110m-PIT-SAG07]